MRHINGCDWCRSVVTGSPKDFWCDQGVTKDFWCGHGVTEDYSALSHGVMEQCCAEQSQRTLRVHPMVPQVPSSLAAHALSESRYTLVR